MGEEEQKEKEEEEEKEIMPEWLVWTVAISSIVAALAQVVSTFLQWFMLGELGDIDEDANDFWEKWPFRKRKDCE